MTEDRPRAHVFAVPRPQTKAERKLDIARWRALGRSDHNRLLKDEASEEKSVTINNPSKHRSK